MEKIWECKIGGEVGDLPAGADGPMRQAVQTAFKTLTGVEASFTFSGWGATLTEIERAVHENRAPNCGAMQEAIDAGDGTLHGAIEYWHKEALHLRAELAACREDAERYRWLRDDCGGFEITVREENEDGYESWVSGYPGAELDAAIDAARKGEGE